MYHASSNGFGFMVFNATFNNTSVISNAPLHEQDLIKIKMKITLVKVIHILHDTHIWYMITFRKYLTRTSMHTGSVVVVIAWKLDLQLPVQSVLITTEVVMSNPAQKQ
jgi:hypothetical protein